MSMAVETQIIKIEAAHDNFRSRELGNSDAQLFYVDNLVRKRRSYSGRKRLSYSSGAIAVGLPPAAESLGQAKCAASREGRREAFTGETGCGIRGNDWQQGARKCRRRDRLGDRTRTLMCEEKIHLFDTSSSFGFSRFGGDGRARWENDLLCWGWTVSSRCVGEKIQRIFKLHLGAMLEAPEDCSLSAR